MASTNQSPFYKKAEEKFLVAKTDEEKIIALEEMIRECPKHKSSEKMLAQLRTRYKKLKDKIERGKKIGKSGKAGIKKEEMQATIIGGSNTGKSSLLSILTNAHPEITPYNFTTKTPLIGMMKYQSTNIQLIEVPAPESEYYDRGIVNTSDTIIILVTDLNQIESIRKKLVKAPGKRIIVFSKIDKYDEEKKRKISATLSSKKYNFILISAKTGEGIEELKDKIFQSFEKIRVYTKEPGKEKSSIPIILKPGSTVRNIAEKILKGFSNKVKETKIWGPSSKFPSQRVGLQHELKDLDVVEFRTK